LRLGRTKAFFINTVSNDKKPSVQQGALEDLRSLEDACQVRSFDFEYLTTLNNGELGGICQLLADKNFTKFSKIVLFILAHGNQNDEIVSHGNCFIIF
jgi:hypothetical protein